MEEGVMGVVEESGWGWRNNERGLKRKERSPEGELTHWHKVYCNVCAVLCIVGTFVDCSSRCLHHI